MNARRCPPSSYCFESAAHGKQLPTGSRGRHCANRGAGTSGKRVRAQRSWHVSREAGSRPCPLANSAQCRPGPRRTYSHSLCHCVPLRTLGASRERGSASVYPRNEAAARQGDAGKSGVRRAGHEWLVVSMGQPPPVRSTQRHRGPSATPSHSTNTASDLFHVKPAVGCS